MTLRLKLRLLSSFSKLEWLVIDSVFLACCTWQKKYHACVTTPKVQTSENFHLVSNEYHINELFKWTLLVNTVNTTPLEGTIRAANVKKTAHCSCKEVKQEKLFWAVLFSSTLSDLVYFMAWMDKNSPRWIISTKDEQILYVRKNQSQRIKHYHLLCKSVLKQ